MGRERGCELGLGIGSLVVFFAVLAFVYGLLSLSFALAIPLYHPPISRT